jgi:hypothetical protein
MFALVRKDVVEETKGAQFPLVDDGIIGDYAMVGTVADPGIVKPVKPVEPQQPQIEPPGPQASINPLPLPAPAKKPAATGARQFIIADSDRRALTWDELTGLSGSELRVARNEIYARHGRIFKDQQLAQYFAQFSWYSPTSAQVFLSDLERKNATLIQQVESSR